MSPSGPTINELEQKIDDIAEKIEDSSTRQTELIEDLMAQQDKLANMIEKEAEHRKRLEERVDKLEDYYFD